MEYKSIENQIMGNKNPNNKENQGSISNSRNAMNNSQMGNVDGNVQFGNNTTYNNYTNPLENLTKKQRKELENKKDERLEMLDALEARYKERLSKKMEGENLKIEFEPKYTKVGTTKDYRKIVLNHYHEGKTVDTNTLYNDFLSKKQLLVIGEAGSGKTVLVLTIAQKLIVEAKKRLEENDTSFPYPILLNLATWRTEDNYTFKEWLEKNLVYAAGRSGVSKKYAKELAEKNNMILFLDGLDEIPESDRKACVEAMKVYFKEKSKNSKFPIGIICCRKNEYLKLKQDLPTRAITEIVPLTLEKVKNQLENKNIVEADILLKRIEENSQAIQEKGYLTTVFEVNIALSLSESHLLYDFELEKLETQNLVDAYINQELKKIKDYKKKTEKAKHYLSFLAKKLQESKKGITFELIDMHSGWLNTFLFQIIYTIFFCLGFIISFSTTQSLYGIFTLFFLPIIFIISKEPDLFAIKNSNNIHRAYYKIWLSSFTPKNLRLYLFLSMPLPFIFLLEISLYIKILAAIIVFTKIIFATNIFRYFLLMLCLYKEKNIPINLVSFLNKVSKTGLMEKDGGQWRFRHQLIQDRLAGKEIRKN